MFSIFDEPVKCPRFGFHLEPAIWYIVSKDLHILSWYNAGVFLVCGADLCFPVEEKADGRGSKLFDVNLRTISAFREIEKGHGGIETFCGCMNMPPPMTELTTTTL